MKLSQKGEDLLVLREGEILKVYRDSKGLPTMGVGHLLTPAEKKQYPVGTKISREYSRLLLRQDLAATEGAIAANVKVPLTQNQYDALVSLIFNIGVEAFKRSTVLRRLNEGDYARAANAFLLWNQPPEIRGRRSKEFAQFKTPYSLAPDPAPTVNVVAASDQKGDGGTQTNPTNPSSLSLPSLDDINDKANKLSTIKDQFLSLKAMVPAKSVSWLTLAFGFVADNKYAFIAGFFLVVITSVLLYFAWRKRKREKQS